MRKIINIDILFIVPYPYDSVLKKKLTLFYIKYYSAEDWNLPSPLATCALKIIRRDNSLIVKILASRPKVR